MMAVTWWWSEKASMSSRMQMQFHLVAIRMFTSVVYFCKWLADLITVNGWQELCSDANNCESWTRSRQSNWPIWWNLALLVSLVSHSFLNNAFIFGASIFLLALFGFTFNLLAVAIQTVAW